MTELICIVCPKGCRLKVDESFNVTGNACVKGEEYGMEELRNPVRVITSTVRIKGAANRRCPVKTSRPIPKGKIFEAMRTLDDVCLVPPIKMGQVVVQNILGLDVSFVATRDIKVV